MSIDEVVEEMRRTGELVSQVESPIRLAAPLWGTPASEAEVAELEAVAGGLPGDYRRFLLQHGSVSAMDVFNGYDIFSASEALTLTRRGDGPRQIQTGIEVIPVVTCGGDGGGNLHLIGSGEGAIFKWLHEYGLDDQRTAMNQAVEFLAPDFTSYLRRVTLDWKHFVADDRAWKYIAG